MSRFASSSPTGFAPPAPDLVLPTIGHNRRDALYRRPSHPDPRTIPVLRTSVEETPMAVDGNWNITMSTPMGERNATLTRKNAGGALTGTQGADGNSTEIFDGSANGDNIAGEMGIGPMGSFPFTGTRA